MRTDVFPSLNTLQDVHDKLLIPFTYALNDIEINGFNVDMGMWQTMETSYLSKLEFLKDRIRAYPEVKQLETRLGKEFNINSNQQVKELFFTEMGLDTEGLPKTKKGDKTSTGNASKVLLKGAHDIIAIMLEYDKYATMYKMFIKPLPGHVMSDGRVHSSYLIHGTVTGRLASTQPNMQQVPRKIKDDAVDFEFDPKLNIKNLFIPTNKDYVLLQSDYSQLELRILAEYSQDPLMLETFLSGGDIHLATARELSGDPNLDKGSAWRDNAKTVNFGIVYGKTPETLARDLGITLAEANKFMAMYFSKMPRVKECIEYMQDFVVEHKYVSTMFGRIRHLKIIDTPDKWVKYKTLRQAVNSPIQGTATDYNGCSSIEINNIFKQYKMKSKIVGLVHDNILFDVFKKELKAVVEIVKTIMPNPQNKLIYWDSQVPLEVDVEVGDKWSEVAKYQA